MLFPRGIAQAGVALILDRLKYRGGEAFQAGESGIVGLSGSGERGALDVGSGAEATLAGGGGNAAFFPPD